MKKREPRKAVLLPARMRTNTGWVDVSIHNVSAHGMMLQAVNAPQPGSYLEIRRATTVIIARTIWVKGHFFGIRSQDELDARALATGRSATAVDSLHQWNGTERRTMARVQHQENYEQSRQRAMMAQFAAVAVGGIALITWIGMTIVPMLSHTSTAIQAAMAGTP